MGRGAVQAQAIFELLALPANHPMKRTTMEYLAVLQTSLNVGQNLSTDERILAMNLSPVYEKWRQETLDEGLQQGLEQGLQRGRQEEGRSLILRQLTRRIGTIAPTLESKILTLSIVELETLGEALLDFSSSADLDNWLRALGA
jgi:predicted transposase YdaD